MRISKKLLVLPLLTMFLYAQEASTSSETSSSGSEPAKEMAQEDGKEKKIEQRLKKLEKDFDDVNDLTEKSVSAAMAGVAAMSNMDFTGVKLRTLKIGTSLAFYKSNFAIGLGLATMPVEGLQLNAKVAIPVQNPKQTVAGIGATYDLDISSFFSK